jgi:DNA helicase MCM8
VLYSANTTYPLYLQILVVGDPGLGKSQMLGACATVAPRGVMVTGNSTTSSGLTVTVSKESGNEVALEAGALVMADQGTRKRPPAANSYAASQPVSRRYISGCCCIDEFDKMGSQHTALLEAMEQQAVSIAKSGIVCTLPARTAVLAAANPTGGHYNKDKTVSQNLRLSPALLSRFDLVFILIDRPNEELDGIGVIHGQKVFFHITS